AAPPAVGLPDEPLDLGVGHVAGPADLRHVSLAADPGDHLADVAHGPARHREVGQVDNRLVAEFQGAQVALPAPHLGAVLTAADHGRHPGVPVGLVQEGLDRAGPRLRVADRVPPGQYDARHDPVADAGLAGRRPDYALVVAQREVAERVQLAVPAQQFPDPFAVGGGQPAGGLGRA